MTSEDVLKGDRAGPAISATWRLRGTGHILPPCPPPPPLTPTPAASRTECRGRGGSGWRRVADRNVNPDKLGGMAETVT